jgi:hypothetical protein
VVNKQIFAQKKCTDVAVSFKSKSIPFKKKGANGSRERICKINKFTYHRSKESGYSELTLETWVPFVLQTMGIQLKHQLLVLLVNHWESN